MIERYSMFLPTLHTRPKRRYTSIETFAGAGGLGLGLEQAGFDTQLLVEQNKHAGDTLKHNRPDWTVWQEDIHESVKKDLPEVDVISGGYPCQAFSYSGNRKGLDDTRGTLFYAYAQMIKKTQPKVFIAENVKGLVRHDKGRSFETMLKVFEDLGYTMHWNVFNAWHYGVAQKRERLVMVGIRNDINLKQRAPFAFPAPLDYFPVLKDVLKDVPKSPGTSYSERKLAVMKQVPPGGCWVNLPDDVAREYMGKAYFSGGGRRGMARRLSWDAPSLTLTTSPSQKQTERCHPDEVRPLTVREYARIQGFPDDWAFSGGVTAQYRQIGNAVPVPLAKAIGSSVIHYLNQFE